MKTLGFGGSRRLASALLFLAVMLLGLLFDGVDLPSALFVIAVAIITVVVFLFLGDDDLPGPRRCLVRTYPQNRVRS